MSYGGTYKSLTLGVSRRPRTQRLDGQHAEQVNMITDPSRGVTRRHGTRWLNRFGISTNDAMAPHRSDSAKMGEFYAWVADFGKYRWRYEDQDMTVYYPRKPRPAWLTHEMFPNDLITIKNEGGQREIRLTANRDAVLMERLAGGVGAITQVGRYLMFAPANTVPQKPADQDLLGQAWNIRKAVVEIKASEYDAVYGVRLTINGSLYQGYHVTRAAAYGGQINMPTEGPPDPATGERAPATQRADYADELNEQINLYNNRVTAHIKAASDSVKPENIIQGLYNTLTASGVPLGLSYQGQFLYIDREGLQSVETNCTTNEDAIVHVHMIVKEASELSAFHYPGKVVMVQARKGEPAYYMKAQYTSTVDTPNFLGFGPVRWTESTRDAPIGTSHIPFPFMLLGMTSQGTGPYYATSPGNLRTAMPGTIVEMPDFNVRKVGDVQSSPTPYFLGRKIDFIGTFQDRLVVGVGDTICMSEVGNYFNFYRTSVLTVLPSDPVQTTLTGGVGDKVKHSVMHDRHLMLFGDRQYLVRGDIPFTESSKTIPMTGSIDGATQTVPVATGNMIYFASRGERYASLHRINVKDKDNTNSFTNVSLQVPSYMKGAPVDVVAVTEPATIVVRTDQQPHCLFLFRHVSDENKSLLEAWFRFDYTPDFGVIIGMEVDHGKLILLVLRESAPGMDDGGSAVQLVLEEQSLLSTLSVRPYLDSLRVHAANEWNLPSLVMAVADGDDRLQGESPVPESITRFVQKFPGATPNNLYVGLPYKSYVSLTSPVYRDRENLDVGGKASFIINTLFLTYEDSGGLSVDVVTNHAEGESEAPQPWVDSWEFTGGVRVLDHYPYYINGKDSFIGKVAIKTDTVDATISEEASKYVATIMAKNWLPLTITGAAYDAQWKSKSKRRGVR